LCLSNKKYLELLLIKQSGDHRKLKHDSKHLGSYFPIEISSLPPPTNRYHTSNKCFKERTKNKDGFILCKENSSLELKEHLLRDENLNDF
jgi:hypothetical protein